MVSHSSGSGYSRRPAQPSSRTGGPDPADAAELWALATAADDDGEAGGGGSAGESEARAEGGSVADAAAADAAGEGLAGAAASSQTAGGGRVSAGAGSGGADHAAGEGSSGAPASTQPPAEAVTPAEAVAEALTDPDPDSDPPTIRPKRGSQAARIAFLVLTLAAGAYAVARQWSRVQSGFAELGPVPVIVALVPALASVVAMMLAWKGLLGSLGSPLRFRPAARIFFPSQLGKYLPGAVWPMVAQMQLGRAYRIPRARSVAAAALAMLVSLGSALVLAAATLPLGGGSHSAGYLWAFIAVPVLLAGLHPKVANPALRTLFRLTRRPAIEPLTGRTLAETAGRSIVGWLLAGAHIWVLAVALGASPGRTLLLGIGGYAFAWSVGFIIVFAPAGAGVRELILVAALQPVLDSGKATVVALASRLVTIIADLIAAALTARGEKVRTASEAAAASGKPSARPDSASPPAR